MASLELDPSSGRYRVRFRFEGREYKRSLRTKQRRAAEATLGQVEETIRLLQLGIADVPPKVDTGDFIVSGARTRREQRPQSPVRTLADLFRIYQEELPEGAKEQRTLDGERIHFKHLLKHLKPSTVTASLCVGNIQRYVEKRSKDKFHGRFISPETIKKEITTFRLVWNWAKNQGYLDSPAPVERIIYPKRDEKPPFMTMPEINRVIDGGKQTERRVSELWESLYLTHSEVNALLKFVAKQDREPFVYPMFVLVAHTGMRRSELVRSERTDFDFDNQVILIREKKRSRKHALSYRRVPMTALVERIFQAYFDEHPNQRFTLSRPSEAQLSEDTVTNQFKSTLAKSAWENVRGFHVLRHSFASNAAAEGIDQRMIDDWMGHQTEEMRQRYRHLTPDSQRAAIDSMFANRPTAKAKSKRARRAS